MTTGTLCYATEQGLGYLAKSFYDHGLIDRVLLFQHPNGRPTMKGWYPPDTKVLVRRPFYRYQPERNIVEQFVHSVQAMLFFETPFDWSLVAYCKKAGVKTILVPMYEWSLDRPPEKFDQIINPSLLDQDYFPEGRFLPVPVETRHWKLRKTATRFLHNGGHLGSRHHKGTEEVLQAALLVRSGLELTVRSQNLGGLKELVRKYGLNNPPPNFTLEGAVPYERLWDDHDVLVAPEKYNGLSLPLQEAYAAGMLVLTTDRYPANTWLPKEGLLPYRHTRRARTMSGHKEFAECVVDPRDVAEKMDYWYGKSLEDYSLGALEWARQHSWETLGPAWREALNQ